MQEIKVVCVADEDVGRNGNAYTYTRIVKTNHGHTLRVNILRNAYRFQSYAHVHVLSTELEWTLLATCEPSEWWESTEIPYPQWDIKPDVELGPLADKLVRRALTILS